MAWTDSRLFRAFVADNFTRTAAFDIDTDQVKAALFNASITPNQDAAAASTAYNTGVWLTAAELSESGQWAAGGVVLASKVVSQATAGVVFFDAADTASGTDADITAAVGCLVYDDALTTPVADQGICFNYFGGAFTSTNGTFTVQWHVDGVFRLNLVPA